MKKLPILLGILLLITALVIGSIYLYIFRKQAINLNMIPSEFVYCKKQITASSQEYKDIVSWLHANNESWRASFVSFVPSHRYYHPEFYINVLSNTVVVSYKTDSGYLQLVRSGQHGLPTSCQ